MQRTTGCYSFIVVMLTEGKTENRRGGMTGLAPALMLTALQLGFFQIRLGHNQVTDPLSLTSVCSGLVIFMGFVHTIVS